MKSAQGSGEFAWIAAWSRGLSQRSGVNVGIGDDCAVLSGLRCPLVTIDALVDGVHFRRDWIERWSDAVTLGRRAMAVNLSDLAAGGAWPVAAFVSLVVPPDLERSWLDELYKGFEESAARWNFTLAGGDTTRGPALVISLCLIGELMDEARGEPVLRSGARPGDLLCVTGPLGNAAAGLNWLLAEPKPLPLGRVEPLLRAHFEPQPRLEAMRALLGAARPGVHAGLDLSDGLAGDAGHLALASNVDLEIDADALKCHPSACDLAAVLGQPAWRWALEGGDDYELLIAIEPAQLAAARSALQEKCGLDLLTVGRVQNSPGEGQVAVRREGVWIKSSGGYQHF